MIIERLETFAGAGATVVRLTTDTGERGIGQFATGGEEVTTDVFHRFVAPNVLGRDPTDPEALVDAVLESPGPPRPYKYNGTFFLRGLGGVDTACWDLCGKLADEPVVSLLGGPADPDPIAAYGSRLSRDTTAEEEIEICREYHDRGLDAFKLKIGKRLAFRTDEDVWPGRTEAVVSGVREALGPDVDLLVDANGAYSRAGAIEVGTEVLAPADVIHFEEPCPYWELEWTKAVTEAVPMDVAGGEQDNMISQWGKTWERIIGDRVVDVVQPDVGYIGGVARTMRVARLAAEAGLPCVPHGPNHSLQKVFTLHAMAAVENAGPYPFEYRIPERGEHEFMYAPEPRVENGTVSVPTGPGWGVELDEEWLFRSTHRESTLE